MKSITVKETKIVWVLDCIDDLHDCDIDFNDMCVDAGEQVIIKRQDICVPSTTQDLDTMIEVDGDTYFTLKKHLKEETITVSSKELFIPTFEGIGGNVCSDFPTGDTSEAGIGCHSHSCVNCILDEDNRHYLKD